MAAGRTQEIRRFLLLSPRPETVRVTAADGEIHDFPTVGSDGRSVRWATLAASVDALEPVTIQCLSKAGGVERAIKVTEWDPAPPKSDALSPQQPPLPEYLHDDPETARFALVARLLADAHKFSTGIAFQKLTDIVDTMSRRMDAMEAKADRSEERYRNEVYDRIDDMLESAAEQAEGEGDGGDILSTFAAAVNAGRNGAPPPNGARPRAPRARGRKRAAK